MPTDVSLKKLILVPAVITFAVTLLRLVGELMHWSPLLFNPAPGGGGALVGIAWLVPVFGIYFAVKLARAGERPSSAGAAIVYALLGGLLLPALGFVASKLGVPQQSLTTFGVFVVGSVVGGVIAFRGWPALGRTLLAYGLAARIPVAIVMLFAILGDWGTHYDVPPPGLPAMDPIRKWLLIGLLPQMTIWVWYTIVVGALFGGLAVAVTRRVRRPAIATGLGTLLLLSAAAAYADVKQPNCFKDAFEGHCVAVTVNGQKTVRIAKKTKNMLKERGALSQSGGETRYEVPLPVRGGLEVHADWVSEAVAYFGPQPKVDVIVIPLEGQSLDTRAELSTAPSVQAGGSAVVTQADVIQGNRLPRGNYVLAIRVYGSRRSWDRQVLFVQVAE